jgi:hypothetical protein
MKVVGLTLGLLLLPTIASAQDAVVDQARGWRPPPVFVADLRAAFPTYPQDQITADRLGVTRANLPGRGLGLVFGAQIYPLRTRRVTLGIGGDVLRSRGTGTLEPEDDDEEDAPEGPTVRTRFSAVSPQVSLNFGARNGWSYISGGLGWARFSMEREDLTAATEDAPRRRTLNYGGGARWFMREHVAFSLDLRFYSIAAQAATTEHPDMPKMRRMVFSAGVSFR